MRYNEWIDEIMNKRIEIMTGFNNETMRAKNERKNDDAIIENSIDKIQ